MLKHQEVYMYGLEPIQFLHGTNWILHVPNGREDARRALGHMVGHFHALGLPFTGIVQDYRSSLHDA